MTQVTGTTVHKVVDDEHDRIEKLRPGKLKGEPYWGLAHSGGGIRSAAFSLGVLQALHRAGKLERLDYLSTVSGGGYSGGSLTWFLRNEKRCADAEDAAKQSADDEDAAERSGESGGAAESRAFPFGRIGGTQKGGGEDNRRLDFIRQHAKYLTPGRGLDMMSLVGVALRSMFVSLLVYGALMVVAWFVLHGLRLTVPPGAEYGQSWLPWVAGWPTPATTALALAYGLAALLVVLAALYSLSTALPGLHGYAWSVHDQRLIGGLWKVFVLLMVVGSVPWVRNLLPTLLVELASPSVGLGSLLGMLQYRAEQKGTAGGLGSTVRVYAAVFFLLYGMLLLTFGAAEWMWVQPHPYLWLGAAAALALVVGGLVNMNHAGLHRMYRDRLMETFMPDPGAVAEGEWKRATEADSALIGTMCTTCRPYHLVNTNVVLVDSNQPRFRGRGGDSFLLSPLYCGSDATGWKDTSKFNTGLGNRGMTLATAVAISGAAVNPNTGVAGRGATRSRLVSALMTLLNLRLGYWAVNPSRRWGPLMPANYLWPGLRSLLGMRLDEEAWVIELTDGGHFENLALYELIRRRVEVIIVSDAGADPDFRFDDLGNALERTRVDFGVTIRFRDNFGIGGLIPGSAATKAPLEPDQLAARGYAVADIWYPGPDDSHGTLIYLKSTLTPGLPADVYAYKKANKEFPDQPTSDQFFDEAQFEAYRELGYQLAKRMTEDGVLPRDPVAAPSASSGTTRTS